MAQNKIYYDVNIPYKAEDQNPNHHYYSKAETEIRLNGPLISDPLNYDLAISKFKIDTECLPVFIPEMSHPQENDPALLGEMKSRYMVTMYYPKMLNPRKTHYRVKRSDAMQPFNFIPIPSGFDTTSENYEYLYEWKDGVRNIVAYRIRLAQINIPRKWTAIPQGHQVDTNQYEYMCSENDHTNNGHIYEPVSDYVTFFPNEGSTDKDQSQFQIKNKFPTMSLNNQSHPDNTREAYFQYDYQSVLDRINVCMERLLYNLVGKEVYHLYYPKYPPTEQEFTGAIFFKLVDGLIHLYVSKDILDYGILFKFSANLYKYIGNGFQCRFYNDPTSTATSEKSDGSFFIDYNPFAWRHRKILDLFQEPSAADTDPSSIVSDKKYWSSVDDPGLFMDETDFIEWKADETKEITKAGIYNMTGAQPNNTNYSYTKRYSIFKQQYSTLANWNVCKCVLLCSSSFPVKAEYYPTSNKNVTLTHYNEDWYVNLLREGYKTTVYAENNRIFDKSSTKILDVYYPVSTSAGDIRSCIIYSNENIENGNKIDMVGGMDLENFDINVKWVDIYNNVYDLYLAPGCSVSVRLCLTRKKILKDELVNAFGRIISSLEMIAASKQPVVDDSKTFDVVKEPRRKRNKVELPGVLENGLIIKP